MTDYVSANMDLTFPAGTANASSQCLTITITDGADLGEHLYFTVTLSTTDLGVMLQQTVAMVTITANNTNGEFIIRLSPFPSLWMYICICSDALPACISHKLQVQRLDSKF